MFVIPSVTRQMLDMKVQCLVTNAEGSGGDTTVIDVACEYTVSAAGHVTRDTRAVFRRAEPRDHLRGEGWPGGGAAAAVVPGVRPPPALHHLAQAGPGLSSGRNYKICRSSIVFHNHGEGPSYTH